MTSDPKPAPTDSSVTKSDPTGQGDAKVADAVSVSRPRPPLKKRLVRWAVLLGVLGLGGFLVFRWAGTSELRGTVQRVYESGPESRFEFVENDGQAYVIGNQNVAFPYFKTEAQDLHAQLVRFAHTRDVVEVNVWGLRVSWLGLFPNVISVEFAESQATRARRRATQIADAALEVLDRRGALDGGDDVRNEVIDAVQRADKAAQ